MVAFRDGRGENEDAISDSTTCSYILIYILVTGVRLGVLLRCRLLRAWVYDSIIYSGVNRWGRDVHCIVGVLGKSSHTLWRS